jgi:hypothetical protein
MDRSTQAAAVVEKPEKGQGRLDRLPQRGRRRRSTASTRASIRHRTGGVPLPWTSRTSQTSSRCTTARTSPCRRSGSAEKEAWTSSRPLPLSGCSRRARQPNPRGTDRAGVLGLRPLLCQGSNIVRRVTFCLPKESTQMKLREGPRSPLLTPPASSLCGRASHPIASGAAFTLPSSYAARSFLYTTGPQAC